MARFSPLREEAREHAAALGAPLTGPVATELVAAMDELTEPGPFLALSNGDAKANNILLNASGPADPRLIDFEFAGYAHALADAVCLYVPGPAWMSVGDPDASGLADQYRRALATGVPEVEDDRRYGFGLAAACLAWALVRLQRLPLLDARPPGDDSRAQLIATLEAAGRTAATYNSLPHLGGWARRVAALLRLRWPDADLDLTDPAAISPYTARR
ncbi:phosphotransferase [Streptomyces sp. NPDC087440]|uniref:phosphotransferase n=1 Tax=Streptomyces sp. NPDC087440 TaxID=3365790 RepID=UPI0037F42057